MILKNTEFSKEIQEKISTSESLQKKKIYMMTKNQKVLIMAVFLFCLIFVGMFFDFQQYKQLKEIKVETKEVPIKCFNGNAYVLENGQWKNLRINAHSVECKN